MRVPCYSCAPGKSILAQLPDSELESYLKRVNLKKFTDRTLSTARTLREELAKIRESGCAVDLAEGLEEFIVYPRVILDDYQYPVGSITTIAPAFRMPPEDSRR